MIEPYSIPTSPCPVMRVNQFPSINFHLIFQVSFPKLKRFALPGGTALCLALLGLSAPPAPRPACVSGGAVVSASDQVETSGGAAGASEMRGLTRMWRCWPLERFRWTILGRTERGKWTVTKFSSYREVSMSEMYIYRNVKIKTVIQQLGRVWKKSITYLKRDSWCWFRLWNFNSTGDDHAFHFLLITKHLARSFLPHYQVNKKTPIIQLYLLYFQTVNPQPFCLPTTLTPKHSMYGVFTKKNPPNSGKYIHFHWASGTDCPPPAKVDLVL